MTILKFTLASIITTILFLLFITAALVGGMALAEGEVIFGLILLVAAYWMFIYGLEAIMLINSDLTEKKIANLVQAIDHVLKK